MIIVKIQDSHTGKGKRWRTIQTRQTTNGNLTPIDINEIHVKGGVRRFVRFLASGDVPESIVTIDPQPKALKCQTKKRKRS